MRSRSRYSMSMPKTCGQDGIFIESGECRSGMLCHGKLTISTSNLYDRTKLLWQQLMIFLKYPQSTHCLGMSYYVNFLGGLGSNELHIK